MKSRWKRNLAPACAVGGLLLLIAGASLVLVEGSFVRSAAFILLAGVALLIANEILDPFVLSGMRGRGTTWLDAIVRLVRNLRFGPGSSHLARPGWAKSRNVQRWVSRILRIASVWLPADLRCPWANEVAGSLAKAESGPEWARALLSELLALPSHAWVFRRERRREPVR